MTIILELENPERWQTRDSQFFSIAPESELVLAEYTSAVFFNSNIICTLIVNSEAPERWKSAGYIAQKLNIPVGPPSVSTKLNYQLLWLYEKQLIFFPAGITNYQLTMRFPKWFTQVSVTVWEYTGL